MNAQEAIELMENEISGIVEEIDYHTARITECKAKEDEAGVSYYMIRRSHHEMQLEFKSIVLESAKELHERLNKCEINLLHANHPTQPHVSLELPVKAFQYTKHTLKILGIEVEK